MFGTLKPHACALGCGGRHEYERFYCGLCKGLGDNFGQLSRGMVSYDAVFLALVADGLVGEGAEPDRCRCPLLPVTFRPTVRPDSPAMRYAAAMTMLLSDQWLADRAMDGRRTAKAARPLLAGRVRIAHEILGELGISLADLDGFEDRQRRVEVPGETGPRDAAEPTAAALERVFERMVLLPGVADEARTPEAKQALASFGRRLGSAIYLIDALDDLEKDHRGGAFNPSIVASGEVSWARVEEAWALLHDDLAALGELSAALPLRRHRELVHGVVAVELRRQAYAGAKRAHAYARAEHARRTAERRAEPWARRALAAAATVFVFLWVWLSSFAPLAFAQRRPSTPPRRPGAAAPSASAPPEGWEPTLPPAASGTAAPATTPGTQPDSPPTSSPSRGTPPSTQPGGADPTKPGASPGGGSTPLPGPGPAPAAPGSGGGCQNPCSGCCDKGSASCKSCFGCCDGCSNLNCGKPCDSCCSGCNLCNGCNGCCK